MPLLFVGIACVVNILGGSSVYRSVPLECSRRSACNRDGAGQEQCAKRATFTGMLIGGSIGILIALLSFFRGDLLAMVFSNDAAVIARAAEYLRGFAPEAVVTTILFSFVGYFNGHQKTLFVMLQGLAQTFIVRLPMSYFMILNRKKDS